MSQAQNGDQVQVHYTGRLDDGTVFDSSEGRAPLSFQLGGGQVIPGFEEGITGMTPGDTKTVTIPAEQAYGPYRDEQIVEVEKSMFPPDIEPEIGQQLQVQQMDGSTVQVQVKAVKAESVLLDANHPLAGKDLTFDLELVAIG